MAFTNSDLSIELYFDLDNTRFRLKDNSDYAGASPAIDPANIAGVYTCTDPNSNILHQNADFNNPDIEPDSSLYSAYKTFTVAAGVYTVSYSVYDSNTSTTYTKSFTFTYATTDIPTVTISIESDVGLATISSTDATAYTGTITLNTRTHTLTYPASWGSTTTTSIVVDAISLTELYTGEYSTAISSNITNSKADDLIITKTITGTQTHDVWDTDGFYVIKTALNEFYDLWQTNQTDNPKEGRRQKAIWIEICANYTLYNSYKQNGDIENAGEYLDNIKTLLAEESIDTTIDPSVSVPVTQAIPGYATQWTDDSGAPATSVGRTGDYYIDTDDNYLYSKATGSWVRSGEIGGYAYTLSPGTVIVPKDQDDTYDYTNAKCQIIVQSGEHDYTTDCAYADAGTGSDVTATVGASTGLVTVTNLASASGYFDVTVSKTYLDDVVVRIYVKELAEGDSAYSASVVSGNIAIPTDADGNNADYTDAETDILIYRGSVDDTSNWSFAKGSVSDADGSVADNTLTITSITADTGYVEVDCTKAGVSSITVRVYVKKIKEGQAVVDATSVDDDTIEVNVSDKLQFKKEGNRAFYDITNSSGVVDTGAIMDWISETRIAYSVQGTNYLRVINYAEDDVWTTTGTQYSLTGDAYRIINFGYNRIAMVRNNVNDWFLDIYTFSGTTWSKTAGILVAENSQDWFLDICVMDYNSIACLIYDHNSTVVTLRKYYFTGSSLRLIGEEFQTALSVSTPNYIAYALVNLDDNSVGVYSNDDTTFIVYNFYDPLAPGESNGSGSVSIEDAFWYKAHEHTISLGTYVRMYNLGNGEILLSRPSQNKIYNYYYERGQLCVLSNTYSISASSFIYMSKLPSGIIVAQTGANPFYSLLRYKII